MKIYTKTGDTGETSLLGGTRVPKFHLRIEAYGTVDELNSHIGLIRDNNIKTSDKEILLEIQNLLFVVGSHLAKDPEKEKVKIPEINESHVTKLETLMDDMNNDLPDLKFFVLPGGHSAASQTHVARCVCRRAERITIQLAESSTVEPIIIKYLNRLSDYLFVLSRKIIHDFNAEEIPWISR